LALSLTFVSSSNASATFTSEAIDVTSVLKSYHSTFSSKLAAPYGLLRQGNNSEELSWTSLIGFLFVLLIQDYPGTFSKTPFSTDATFQTIAPSFLSLQTSAIVAKSVF